MARRGPEGHVLCLFDCATRRSGACDLLDTLDKLVGVGTVLRVQVGVVRLDLVGQVLALAVEVLEVRATGDVVKPLSRRAVVVVRIHDRLVRGLELAHLRLNARRVVTNVTRHARNFPPWCHGCRIRIGPGHFVGTILTHIPLTGVTYRTTSRYSRIVNRYLCLYAPLVPDARTR